MSVFTNINENQITQLLEQFTLGELVRYHGISEGIENTNYRVITKTDHKKHELILTVFETLSKQELPFFIDLLARINKFNLPVACPIKNRQNEYIQTLADKPAVIVPCLTGRHVMHPNPEHCKEVGKTLGEIHKVTYNDFSKTLHNSFGVNWWRKSLKDFDTLIHPDDKTVAEKIIQQYDQLTAQKLVLPKGIIHGDLFKDNVLFENSKLTGALDFYNACTDYYLYDLAVTVNDWCSNNDGTMDESLYASLIQGYQNVREFTQIEIKIWPLMLQVAALRFWLSRISAKINFSGYDGDVLTQLKDPEEYKQIMLDRYSSQYKIF